jgi:hypothetical protein
MARLLASQQTLRPAAAGIPAVKQMRCLPLKGGLLSSRL